MSGLIDQGLARLNALSSRTGLGPVFERDNARLLWATVSSARHAKMDRALVGFHIEETVGPVTEEDARLYARGTNDQRSYGGAEGRTPPLLLARLVQPLMIRVMTEPRLRLNLLRLVHGEQSVIWHEPIRVGDRVVARVEVVAIEESPAGEIARLSGTVRRDGELLVEARIALMIRGKAAGRPSAERAAPRPERVPDFQFALETLPDQTFRYAEGSGDTNFIHTSPWLARAAGLPGIIVHGMCTLGMVCHRLADQLAQGDRDALHEIGVRFASPVFPGETVTLRGYAERDGAFSFDVVNAKGRMVLKNGRLRLRR